MLVRTSNVLQAVWLLLAAAVCCWESGQVTALPAGHRWSRSSHIHSSRLNEIVDVAYRLERLRMRREKRNLLSNLLDNLEQKSMQRLQERYTKFYALLTDFFDDLVTRLKLEAPSELQYVNVTPRILTPEDTDFTYNKLDSVVTKAKYVFGISNLVFRTMDTFIEDDSKDWFSSKVRLLEVYMKFITIDIGAVHLDPGDPDSDAGIIAGVGGLNLPDKSASQQDLQNLQDALQILENEVNK